MPVRRPAGTIVLFVLALLVSGPRGLSQTGRQSWLAIRGFRKEAETVRTEFGLDATGARPLVDRFCAAMPRIGA